MSFIMERLALADAELMRIDDALDVLKLRALVKLQDVPEHERVRKREAVKYEPEYPGLLWRRQVALQWRILLETRLRALVLSLQNISRCLTARSMELYPHASMGAL